MTKNQNQSVSYRIFNISGSDVTYFCSTTVRTYHTASIIQSVILMQLVKMIGQKT